MALAQNTNISEKQNKLKQTQASGLPKVKKSTKKTEKKDWSFWLQTSAGFSGQIYKNSNVNGNLNGYLGVIRLGANAAFQDFDLTLFTRAKIFQLSGVETSPSWIQAYMGYKLPNFRTFSYVTTIKLYLGMEKYSNNVSNENEIKFIESASSASVGFESRFLILKRLDIGGTFLYQYRSNGLSFFIQGDLRYLLSPGLIWGAGYWYDYNRVTSEGFSYRENSIALEMFLRYLL